MQDIEFIFSRPSGVPTKPSRGISEALRQFVRSDEVQLLVRSARVKNRSVVVHVFHAREGHPMLIHVAAVAARSETC